MSLNKVLLIGRLGAEPDFKMSKAKEAICTFRLATNEKYRNSEGKLEEYPEWHSIVAFGRIATLCTKYLKKGSQVFIEGAQRTSSYVNKEGKKQFKTQVIVKTITLLGKSKDKDNPQMVAVESGLASDISLSLEMNSSD